MASMPAWACSSCGGENPEGMRFCGHCGSPAATATPSPTSRPIEPTAAPPTPPSAPATRSDADTTEALRSFVAGQVADRLVEAGGQLTEERRLVTALFADVSGFTALADRVDTERLLEIIDPVIKALSDVVGRYEGYVEKFAGDALLALFGAPVSHEDDAVRALMVAVEMHRELARVRETLGPDAAGLTLHVGVNTGHGIARVLGSQVRLDYAVLGDSVILAQRLESAAPSGETYVGETTYRLAQDRFEFEPVGELTLKGKRETVQAWRLIGERATTGGPGVGRRTTAPLIGRDEELTAITAVLDALPTGTGGVVTVTAEPGVGKSRLTEEVRARAGDRGVRWLETRCLSYGASLAYWPYADLLRQLSGIRTEDRPDDALRRLTDAVTATGARDAVPFFARLLGLGAGGAADRLEPEAFRRALHEAFASWLRALSRDGPIALALEDGHWADASSTALTAELSRLCRDVPLLVYVTTRPTPPSAVQETTAAAETYLRLAVELQPLNQEAIVELVEHLLGGPAPRALAEMLAERGSGNPFFVEETVRALLAGGSLARHDGVWQMASGWDARAVPPTIEGVLSARIDVLPAGATGLLQVASVIGRRVRIPLLRGIEPQRTDFDSALRQLVDAAFLDRAAEEGEETLLFHHALVQDVAYARLLRRRRRDLHRRVADVAESLYGSGDDAIDLLARHLYLGEAGTRAIGYLVRAAERARRLYANEEAILHLGHAAELARADSAAADRLPEILLDLADLHELVGNYDEALALYSEVRDSTSDVRAWRGAAATLRKQGRYNEALELLAQGFERLRPSGGDLRPLWLERAWTLSIARRMEEALEAAGAGLEAAQAEDPVRGWLLVQLAGAESVLGRAEEGIEHSREALRIFDEHGDLRGLTSALRIAADAAQTAGRLEDASEALRRAIQLAERTGNVEELAGCLINLAVVEQERGALDEAIALDRRAVAEFERIGHGSGRAQGYANLADKLARAGQPEEALAYCARGLEIARSIGHGLAIADITDTVAIVHAGEARYREAAVKAEEAAELYLAVEAVAGGKRAFSAAADAWRLAGETERAEAASARARAL